MAHVDIPPAAVVVDFVLCDSDRRLWDNNHMVDYHSVVRDGLDVEQLTEVRNMEIQLNCFHVHDTHARCVVKAPVGKTPEACSADIPHMSVHYRLDEQPVKRKLH